MNDIFDALMALCSTNEAFYFKDFVLDDKTYRIFNYRLAQYSDFLKPFALEARGIMFLMNGEKPRRIASRPMEKFFNLDENPFTMNLDLERNLHRVMEKVDGSLISTYRHTNERGNHALRLKTKGSLSSDQAIMAERYLNREENYALKQDLLWATYYDYTVNMEFISPQNRIVIGYPEEKLVVLNIRHNETGQYLVGKEALSMFPDVAKYWVEYRTYRTDDPYDGFVDRIVNEEGVEGYVFEMYDGQKVKVKTKWYLTLHHTKDSLNSNRRLFECVINETTDDLRSLFHDDPVAIQRIKDMEDKIIPVFDHMVVSVESYYEANKHLSRKEYAILGQTIDDGLFKLKMDKYTGRVVDYKAFSISHPEFYKVRDDVVQVSEE